MKDFKTGNGFFTGNVGIGTTNPDGTLHAKGIGTHGIFKLEAGGTSGSDNLIHIKGAKAGGTSLGEIHFDEMGVDVGDMIFLTNNGTTLSEKMRVTSGGNVGIGITNPGAKLQIESTSDQLKLTYPSIASYIQTVNSLGDFSISKDGSERLWIASNGNVGIGTTNPVRKFEVKGEATFINNDSEVLISNTADHCRIYSRINSTNAEKDLGIYTGVTEKMRIDASGNVGIGTTNPALTTPPGHATGPMFGLKNSLSASMSLFRDDTTIVNGNAIGGIFFYGNGSTNPASPVSAQELASIECFADEAHDDNAHGSSLSFLTNNGTTLTKRMLIDKDGNVGIGTASPGSPLHIFGQTNNLGGLMLAAAGTNIDSLRFWIDSSSTAHINRGGNEAISITNTRNVGIGTSTPANKLHIQQGVLTGSSTNTNTSVTIEDASNTGIQFLSAFQTQLRFGDADNNGAGAIIYNHTDDLLRLNTAGQIHLEGGNVGIGTTNAGSYRLNVQNGLQEFVQTVQNNNTTNGYGLYVTMSSNHDNTTSEYIRCATNGNANINFRVYSNGTIFSDGSSLGSDDRIKHNEEKIVNAVETLSKITPKKYFKTTKLYEANHDFDLDSHGNPIDENGDPVNHRVEAGVIAQEVLGVDELKFAVSPETKDEDGNVTTPYALNYNSLFTYALAAIQEQQAIIEDLKSRIETLENK